MLLTPISHHSQLQIKERKSLQKSLPEPFSEAALPGSSHPEMGAEGLHILLNTDGQQEGSCAQHLSAFFPALQRVTDRVVAAGDISMLLL